MMISSSIIILIYEYHKHIALVYIFNPSYAICFAEVYRKLPRIMNRLCVDFFWIKITIKYTKGLLLSLSLPLLWLSSLYRLLLV